MLKLFQDKFAKVAESFYAFGTDFFKLAPLLSWLRRHLPKSPALLGIELFVAISLAVYYFFLMLPQSVAPRGIDGNEMNAYLFTCLSDHPYSQKDIARDFTVWKARLAGPMISGWAHDLALKHQAISADTQISNSGKFVFGGYFFRIQLITFGAYQAI